MESPINLQEIINELRKEHLENLDKFLTTLSNVSVVQRNAWDKVRGVLVETEIVTSRDELREYEMNLCRMQNMVKRKEKDEQKKRVIATVLDLVPILNIKPVLQTVSEDESSIHPSTSRKKPAPKFQGIAVIKGSFKNIQLEDYAGKYLVMIFYPLELTFEYLNEIKSFSELVEKFHKIGCEIIVVTTDSHYSNLAWTNIPYREGGLGKIDLPLLSDTSMVMCRAYGAVQESSAISSRSLFIIDCKQNLRQEKINDLNMRQSVAQTLRWVQAFKYRDENMKN